MTDHRRRNLVLIASTVVVSVLLGGCSEDGSCTNYVTFDAGPAWDRDAVQRTVCVE